MTSNQVPNQGVELGFFIKEAPSKDDTGVEQIITKICADLSHKMYKSGTPLNDKGQKGVFNFSREDHDVELQIYDGHGELDTALPRFVAAVTGTTMFLVWRGTATTENWLTNVNISPVVSNRWVNTSKNVRVHGGFLSCIENDLATHESALVKIMRDKGITQVITTGHSLGGGLAQVAQLCIEGSAKSGGSLWNQLKQERDFNVKSITFAAPSSIMPLVSDDVAGASFVKDLGSNSCNIVYRQDPVPHTPANVEGFVFPLLENLREEFDEQVDLENMNWGAWFMSWAIDMDKWSEFALAYVIHRLKTGKDIKKAMDIAKKYRHIGKVIRYENDSAKPEIFFDSEDKDLPGKNFRKIKWEKGSKNIIGEVLINHGFLISGPGLGDEKDSGWEVSSKIYWIHEKSFMAHVHHSKVRVNGWEDCLKKAKEHLVKPSMGAVCQWDNEPSNKLPHERGGTLWIKENLPRHSRYAKMVEEGYVWNYLYTAIWRSGGLEDLTGEAKELREHYPHSQWSENKNPKKFG